jgi:uncharacterized phage protein (TIGR02220 family)
MTRPRKQTVDYFPHEAAAGKTIFILESRWGNDGYAFWFKLLETLCLTEGHVLDYGKPEFREFLLAKTRVSEQVATEILKMLVDMGKLDRELWEKRVIWCQNLVDNVKDAYKKRLTEFPQKPVSDTGNPHTAGFPTPETPQNDQSGAGNPQSKVKESKVKESKEQIRPLLGDGPADPASQSNGGEATAPGNPAEAPKPAGIAEIAAEAISFLNQRAGRRFNTKTPGFVKHVRGRMGEGATLDLFKKVIDFKVWDWKERSRAGNDKDMSQYLTPDTLFNSEKFWKYAEAAVSREMESAARAKVRREMQEAGKHPEVVRKELDAATLAEIDRRKAALKLKYGPRNYLYHVADPVEGYIGLM